MISSAFLRNNPKSLSGLTGTVIIDSWHEIEPHDIACLNVSLQDADVGALAAACRAATSPLERARADRFRRDEDRLRYLVARAVLRGMLEHAQPRITPRAEALPDVFPVNDYGKP